MAEKFEELVSVYLRMAHHLLLVIQRLNLIRLSFLLLVTLVLLEIMSRITMVGAFEFVKLRLY